MAHKKGAGSTGTVVTASPTSRREEISGQGFRRAHSRPAARNRKCCGSNVGIGSDYTLVPPLIDGVVRFSGFVKDQAARQRLLPAPEFRSTSPCLAGGLFFLILSTIFSYSPQWRIA